MTVKRVTMGFAALAAATAMLTTSAGIGAASTPQSWMLSANGNSLPSGLAAEVEAAGGTITSTIPQVGLAFATSSDAGFAATAAEIAGVGSVSPNLTVDWVGPTPGRRRGLRVSADQRGRRQVPQHPVGPGCCRFGRRVERGLSRQRGEDCRARYGLQPHAPRPRSEHRRQREHDCSGAAERRFRPVPNGVQPRHTRRRHRGRAGQRHRHDRHRTRGRPAAGQGTERQR